MNLRYADFLIQFYKMTCILTPPFQPTVKPTYTMPKPAEGTTLFVRNLLFESQEEDLREL
jgi:RNA recognition motif-containing protein